MTKAEDISSVVENPRLFVETNLALFVRQFHPLQENGCSLRSQLSRYLKFPPPSALTVTVHLISFVLVSRHHCHLASI